MAKDTPAPADKPDPATPAGTAGPAVEPTVIPLRWVRVTHKSPDHIAPRYPYAAYGSNLSLEQVSRRCPSADIRGAGVLRNAKAIFAYHMGIVEAEGASVPIAVYNMTAADVAAMDRHEGLGRSYERYLVTVEMGNEAVRCFTYVKRDNDLEEPTERYYQTCLKGYADWDFDARRLRHAREDARKNGKRRTYSQAYGYWSGAPSFDWNKWRKGTGATRTNTGAMIPPVKSYDEQVGQDEPEGNGTAASYQPRISLVTGRPLSDKRQRAVDTFKRSHGSGKPDVIDPARISTLNGNGQEVFTGRDGQTWRKGVNGVWYRAKE